MSFSLIGRQVGSHILSQLNNIIQSTFTELIFPVDVLEKDYELIRMSNVLINMILFVYL
jgi:hypothetical protein